MHSPVLVLCSERDHHDELTTTLWQARRRAELQAGKRGRMHPLRMGRPPGYVKDRLRRDTLQRKLWDFWQFCHWADTATDPPARPAGAGLAPA